MNVAWDYQSFNHCRIREGVAAVTASDSSFYQLDQFYDEKTVLYHLAEPVSTLLGEKIRRFKILDVRHLFAKHFQVTYRLESEKEKNGSVILSVRFFSPGESLLYYQGVIKSVLSKEKILHISSWNAVGSLFPEDVALPALQDMTNVAVTTHLLSHCCGLSPNRGKIEWDLLSYRPGLRCAIKYQASDRSLVGKTVSKESAATIQSQLCSLWEWSDRTFRMPSPIGMTPEGTIRWESFVPGRRIESLFSEIDFNGFVQAVTPHIASLHQCFIKDLPLNDIDAVCRRMENKMIPRICRALAPLSEEIESFFSRLLRRAGTLPGGTLTTIHGDLHTANLLIGEDQPAFIDLDSLSVGDPAYDLALLGSRLLMLALQRDERIEDVVEALVRLPESYESAGGNHISQETFSWYMAALLVGRQLKTCVRERSPELGRLAPILISWARQILEARRFKPSLTEHC